MKQLDLLLFSSQRLAALIGTIIGTFFGVIVGIVWLILRLLPYIVFWICVFALGNKFLSHFENVKKQSSLTLPID